MKRIIYKIYYYFLFKVKDPKKVTLHPRHNKHIKYGFSVGDRHYYRFLHDYDIFESRFRYLKTFYQEVENKLTSGDINEFAEATKKYIDDYEKSLHKGEPKPQLLKNAKELMSEVKYRSEWLFEPTSLYKYASVIYFDLQEDIVDYDVEYNHDKIRYWSKKKTLLRMLLKELMTGVENLLNLSSEDFTAYLSVIQQNLERQQKLTLDSGLESNKESTEVTI
jgi:hypothetical protein